MGEGSCHIQYAASCAGVGCCPRHIMVFEHSAETLCGEPVARPVRLFAGKMSRLPMPDGLRSRTLIMDREFLAVRRESSAE